MEAMVTWMAVAVMSMVAAVMYAGRRRTAVPAVHQAPHRGEERVLGSR